MTPLLACASAGHALAGSLPFLVAAVVAIFAFVALADHHSRGDGR
ncbi:hypothetical protein [Halarchaeum sp. CBA1220]|nr:hypothetical protein [Halarchaeum sp. CBA1220]